LSAAAQDPRPDERVRALLEAVRAFHAGDGSARAPLGPPTAGSATAAGAGAQDAATDPIEELSGLFNALADRVEELEREIVRLRPSEIEADTDADPQEPRGESSAASAEADRPPAILVVEAERAPVSEPMRATAQTALRGLGGVWDRTAVLRVGSPEAVRAALAEHRVVSALFDARGPAELLDSVLAALDAYVPGLPLLCFAPDDDPDAYDRAETLVHDRTRAEVVRSAPQAVERLTLHWLTEAAVAPDPLAEPAESGYGQIRFEGEKVLVVDDDVRNVFAMVSALELYGLTAITADSGPEAIELLMRNPDIGIVLMDLMMPGLDGYATTARIRSMPEFAALPIIAVTARAAPGDRDRSLAAGTNEHVTKPVEVDQLLMLIKRLIKR
jgi:CheY-like chemotaxis protein